MKAQSQNHNKDTLHQQKKREAHAVDGAEQKNHATSIVRRGGPSSLTPSDVLHLQRTIGNRSVVRFLEGVMPTPITQHVIRRAAGVAHNTSAKGIIQRGIIYAFDSNKQVNSKNVKLDETEAKTATIIAVVARMFANRLPDMRVDQRHSQINPGYWTAHRTGTTSSCAPARSPSARAWSPGTPPGPPRPARASRRCTSCRRTARHRCRSAGR